MLTPKGTSKNIIAFICSASYKQALSLTIQFVNYIFHLIMSKFIVSSSKIYECILSPAFC